MFENFNNVLKFVLKAQFNSPFRVSTNVAPRHEGEDFLFDGVRYFLTDYAASYDLDSKVFESKKYEPLADIGNKLFYSLGCNKFIVSSFLLNDNFVQVGLNRFDRASEYKIEGPVMKKKVYKAKHSALNLVFEAKWKNVVTKPYSKVIPFKVNSFEKFSQSLKKGPHGALNILDIQAQTDAVHWIYDNGAFVAEYDVNLSLRATYSVEVERKERLVCRFFDNSEDLGVDDPPPRSSLDVKFVFNLPSDVVIWEAGKAYFKGDLVEYAEKIYSCIVKHTSEQFDKKNWQEKDYAISFKNHSSFFDSDYGSKVMGVIQNNFRYFVETYLGSSIELVCFFKSAPVLPKLDNWFSYDGKKYRITSYDFSYEPNSKLGLYKIVLHGLQLLNLPESLDVAFRADADENDFSITHFKPDDFDGIILNVPDDCAVEREIIKEYQINGIGG